MAECSSASTSTRSTTRTGSRCRLASATRSRPASCSPAGSTRLDVYPAQRLGRAGRGPARDARPVLQGGAGLEAVLLQCRVRRRADKQGRVLVPPALIRHGKLGREVVVAGSTTTSRSGTAAPGTTASPRSKAQTMLPNVLHRSASDHVPVLAEEVRELLAVQPGEAVVDATFGADGHSPARGGPAARKADRDRPRSVRAHLLRPLQGAQRRHPGPHAARRVLARPQPAGRQRRAGGR